jgi:hypothetical protein
VLNPLQREYVKYLSLMKHEELKDYEPTTNRINEWILQKLRFSSLNVNLLARTDRRKPDESWFDEVTNQMIPWMRHSSLLRPSLSSLALNLRTVQRGLWKAIQSYICATLLMVPLCLLPTADAATLNPTPLTVDPATSSSSASVWDIISAVMIGVVGAVVWHSVKRSPNRRPYLVTSLVIAAWMYSMVLRDGAGMWPVSRYEPNPAKPDTINPAAVSGSIISRMLLFYFA